MSLEQFIGKRLLGKLNGENNEEDPIIYLLFEGGLVIEIVDDSLSYQGENLKKYRTDIQSGELSPKEKELYRKIVNFYDKL